MIYIAYLIGYPLNIAFRYCNIRICYGDLVYNAMLTVYSPVSARYTYLALSGSATITS